MRKTTFFVPLILFFFLPQAPAQTCDVRKTGEHRGEIQTPNGVIAVVGWEHLGDSQDESIKAGLDAAQMFLNSRNCTQALLVLEALNQKHQLEIENSAKMLKEIQKFSERFRGAILIANEMTPSEQAQQLQSNVKIYHRYKAFADSCGPQARRILEPTLTMYPGPGFEFARRSQRDLVPVEDEAAKRANAAAFQEGSSFDFTNPAITPDGRAAIGEIQSLLMARQAIPPALIDRVIAFSRVPGERPQLRSGLLAAIETGRRQIEGAYVRNLFISRNLLNLRTNVILPIGYRHVDHLLATLRQDCLQMARSPVVKPGGVILPPAQLVR